MGAQEATPRPRFLPYRPLVPAAVAFAAGILLREYAVLPRCGPWVAGFAFAAAFPLALWAGRRWMALGPLYALMAAAGWARLDVESAPPPPHHIARFLGHEPKLLKLRGVVASDPELQVLPPMPLSGDSKWLAEEARQTRFDLDVSGVMVEGAWRTTCGRMRTVDHGATQGLLYGDTVVVTGTAALAQGPSNPGALDAQTLLRHRGIAATLSLSEGALRFESRGGGGALLGSVYALRSRLREALRTTLPPSTRAASLLCALLLGDRTGLDDDFEEALKRTGTMHLLAISGLHIGVLAWFVWTAAAAAGAGRRLSGLIVVVAVAFYALLTGLPPSVVRATVMTIMVVVGIMGKRQLDLVQSLALAALVLLVLRPLDLFNAGFQLSFLATLSVCTMAREIQTLLRPREGLVEQLTPAEDLSRAQRLRRFVRARAPVPCGVSAAAWLGVFPVGAYYFHIFSPITVFANLPMVPLVALLIMLGFLHVALAYVAPMLAYVTAGPVVGITWVLGQLGSALVRVPLGWAYCPSPPLAWVIAYYALGLIVVARRRIGLSGTRAAMLWVTGVLVYVLVAGPSPPPRGLEATVLDVRHGSSAVLRYPDGRTVVCDCGSYGRSDVGQWVAAPALWHWGIGRIDLLIVSHADADHINGIPALIERFRIGHAVYSPVVERSEAGQQLLAMLRTRGIPHGPVKAGDRIEVGSGNILEVLSPTDWTLRAFPENQNDNSLVVGVRHGERRILLGGDAQQAAVTVLLHSGLDLRADVLVVPHHGCVLQSTDDLARAVRPAYAICSNRADHLPSATVQQYEAAGARVLATCWDGAVTVRVAAGKMEVKGWRQRQAAR